MKQIAVIILCAIQLVTLCACGNTENTAYIETRYNGITFDIPEGWKEISSENSSVAEYIIGDYDGMFFLIVDSNKDSLTMGLKSLTKYCINLFDSMANKDKITYFTTTYDDIDAYKFEGSALVEGSTWPIFGISFIYDDRFIFAGITTSEDMVNTVSQDFDHIIATILE